MTKDQINKLATEVKFPDYTGQCDLVETHISWVFICDQFVYKIKKPLRYTFLDFSTIELRKHFCEREIELNKRLTENIYIDVLPIHELNDSIIVDGSEGKLIDYAVRMHKMDRERQMDILLLKNKVTETDIKNLAEKIAHFHQHTNIIYRKDFMDIKEKFADLGAEREFLETNLGKESSDIIGHAIKASDDFMLKNKELLAERLKGRYFRDCHGDLHSRNIFLLQAPQPFDCIEFNDEFRQIDVLNEMAFLCMDLDSFGRHDLSSSFIDHYNKIFPALKNKNDQRLFIYYKSYRANVRAKVNSLRARVAISTEEKNKILNEAGKYLQLMNHYLSLLHQLRQN